MIEAAKKGELQRIRGVCPVAQGRSVAYYDGSPVSYLLMPMHTDIDQANSFSKSGSPDRRIMMFGILKGYSFRCGKESIFTS